MFIDLGALLGLWLAGIASMVLIGWPALWLIREVGVRRESWRLRGEMTRAERKENRAWRRAFSDLPGL